MTERERFIAALERRPITGLVPTFELVFYLTMEAFGQVFHGYRAFGNWDQMTKKEQHLQIRSIAQLYVDVAEKYGHSAIFVHADAKNAKPIMQQIREISGDKFFIMMHGDATFAIPDGNSMLDFTYRIEDDPDGMKKEASEAVKRQLDIIDQTFSGTGLLDGLALCSDYCFNVGPFFSPDQFSEFVTPFLADLIKGYRQQGLYTIKHTDGNIMPIIDQLVECNPHALHSIDPQAGVDLKEVKRMYGDRVALCGNVNCGLLQTGTDQEVIDDVTRSLRDGMPGFGYIFCTSNCVYTGMPLERYELMNSIWREKGNYDNL